MINLNYKLEKVKLEEKEITEEINNEKYEIRQNEEEILKFLYTKKEENKVKTK